MNMQKLSLFFLALGLYAQNTAQFPGSVVTPAQLGVASNRAETTLTSGINSSATSIPVASSSGFKANSFVTIDNEQLAICAIADGTHLTVGVSACPNADGRGVDTANGGGAAASHLSGAKVQGRIVAAHINQVGAELVALEKRVWGTGRNVREFGALCDGTTDDTSAIQAAIDYGISHRTRILVPSGICRITGSGLHDYGSLSMQGGAGVGEGISILRYEGTGTAFTIQNASLNIDDFTYATELRDITVQAKVGYHPDKGIAIYTLSEGNFNHVTVGGDSTQGRFATGWYCYRANIIEMPRVISSYNDVAFDFVGTFSGPPSIITINNISSVFDADIGFRLNSGISLVVENSFIESTNTVLKYDSSAVSGGVTGVANIVFRGNHVLLNRPGGVDHKVLHVLCGASINLVRGIWIENNYILLPNTYVGANAFVFDAASALFNTGIFATINRNFINGFANELSTSNSGVVYVTFRDNFAVKADGFTHNINHAGSGVYQDAYINDIGNNNFTAQSATLDVADNVGVTSVLIHEGGAQGTSSTLRGVDTGGNTKWFFNKGGDMFSEGALALTHSVSNRWQIVKNGSESGSNAGSNFQIFRYSDAGGFLSSPFYIARDTSRVGFNSTSPPAGMHMLNPDGTVPSVIFDMAAGQSTDAMQLRTSGGTVKWKVDSSGNMTTGLTTTLNNGLLIVSGVGTPEGAVTAPTGSLYMRTNGGAGTSLYVKETGTGNTGWAAK